jgi:hypothetical protein
MARRRTVYDKVNAVADFVRTVEIGFDEDKA